jgi:hypothetical protein
LELRTHVATPCTTVCGASERDHLLMQPPLLGDLGEEGNTLAWKFSQSLERPLGHDDASGRQDPHPRDVTDGLA